MQLALKLPQTCTFTMHTHIHALYCTNDFKSHCSAFYHLAGGPAINFNESLELSISNNYKCQTCSISVTKFTTSSATAEIGHISGNYAVLGHSRSLILVPTDSLYTTSY